MAKQSKVEVVTELTEKIKKAGSIVFIDYKGIKASEETALRKNIREAGAEYVVAKNRLFKIALKEAGVEDNFDDVLEGTTAFAFGYSDVVAPAKVSFKVSEEKKAIFNIKAGYLEGKRIDASKVEALAKLPSREEMLGMIAFGLLSPVRMLACGINAVAEQKEAQ